MIEWSQSMEYKPCNNYKNSLPVLPLYSQSVECQLITDSKLDLSCKAVHDECLEDSGRWYRLNSVSVILQNTCTSISLKLHQQTPLLDCINSFNRSYVPIIHRGKTLIIFWGTIPMYNNYEDWTQVLCFHCWGDWEYEENSLQWQTCYCKLNGALGSVIWQLSDHAKTLTNKAKPHHTMSTLCKNFFWSAPNLVL